MLNKVENIVAKGEIAYHEQFESQGHTQRRMFYTHYPVFLQFTVDILKWTFGCGIFYTHVRIVRNGRCVMGGIYALDFSFGHNVFKSCLLLLRQNAGGKGLKKHFF